MAKKLHFLLPLLLLLLLLLLAFLVRRPRMQTALTDVASDLFHDIPPTLLDRGTALAHAIFLAPSPDLADAAAAAFADALATATPPLPVDVLAADPSTLAPLLDYYAANPAGLLSPRDRADLLADRSPDVLRRHVQSLYSSFAPPLVPPDRDPAGFANDFLSTLATTLAPPSPSPSAATNAAIVELRFHPDALSDLRNLAPLCHHLTALATETAAPSGARALLCGPPFHTALATETSASRIALLTALSLAAILLITFYAFRSLLPLRQLAFVAYTLLLSAAAGFASLFLLYPRYHLFTLVFGTSVLGLTVDYTFHALLAAPPGPRAPAFRRSLLLSWLTTLVSLLPLAFSGLPILLQTALFLAAGLTASLFAVLFLFPANACDSGASPSAPSTAPARPLRPLLRLTLLGLLFPIPFLVALPRLRAATTLADLYAPPPALATAEALYASLTAPPPAAPDSPSPRPAGLLLTTAPTLDEALALEAALPALLPSSANLPDLRLSALLPPLSERQQNATLIAQFLATNAASLRQFGLLPEAPEAVPPLPAPSPWSLDDLPALLRTLVATSPASGAVTLAIPNAALTPDEAALLPPSTRFVAPAALLSNWLTSATRRALRLLLLSFAALLLLLLFLYRRRALPILLVPLLGLLVPATAATLLLHRPVNLFHLLAGFMLVGMALDYAIFLSTAASSARRSVLCAALTSTVAFGALAFVPLPLARSLALTLGLGIPASLLASLLLFPSTAAPQQTAAVEQSASPLGLRLAWLVYRLLGKRTLDRLTDLIALFVWLFNPTVRARAATFSRLRSFTQSLADKIVVMHGATNAPRVILPPPQAAPAAAPALPPDDAPAFLSAVHSRAGVLMISSHLGTIEVLPALGPCPVPIHAYMKAGRTDIFNAFYAAHAVRPAIQIVPFDTFGIPEAIQTAQWLDEGHCVLFAGDRPFGRTLPVPLDAHTTIDLPAGVFRLAATLGHPAFFLCCLRVAPNLYHLHARAAPPPPATDRDIALAYARWLQPLIALHPSQWYHWSAN